MTRPIAVELPPPRTEPLDWASAARCRPSKAERRVAQEALVGRDVLVAVRTRSKADTGGWLRQRAVWAFALADELVLVAAGRDPYVEHIPFAELGESVYNAVTGELALAPAPHVRVRSLRMTPADGYQMLAQIYCKEPDDAGAAG
jgi:hypothetical protein